MSKAQEIGKRIAQARREKGVREHADVRPADVARALKVSGATVSDWESGKVTPREELLAQLASFLGVTPMYLRYGQQPFTPPANSTGHRSFADPDAPATPAAEPAVRPRKGRAAGGR